LIFSSTALCELNEARIVLAVGGHESNITADSIMNILHTYVAHFLTSFGIRSQIHSFIPLARAECDDSLPFLGASSFPLCYVLFLATLLHQLFFPSSLTSSCYLFLGLPLNLVVPKFIYIILFWEFCFLPLSVHAQTNVIYLTLLSLL